MRPVIFLSLALMVIALTACSGNSTITPDPGNTQPPAINVDVPDIPAPDEEPTSTTIKVARHVPTPTRDGTSLPGDGQIQVVEYEYFITTMDELYSRAPSALTNNDREMVETTLNRIAWNLYQHQKSTKTSAEGLGDWAHTFLWNSEGTTFYRNVQGPCWIGLLQYVEVFDLYDPDDPDKTPVDADVLADLAACLNTSATPGFLGDRYNTAMVNHDTDASTNIDRPYAFEVKLYSVAANVFNRPYYQYVAETWWAELADEFTGAEFMRRLIDNRFSLCVWDMSGYADAAVMVGDYQFVDYDSDTDVGLTPLWTPVTDEDDGMLQELAADRISWENIPLGGFDYTNLGWCYLPAPLSALKRYVALTTTAEDFYAEGLTNLFGNTFRHRSYGYYGYEDAEAPDLLFDDSQFGGYALLGLGHANQNDLKGNEPVLFDAMDGQIEFFLQRIEADALNDADIDGDGTPDHGWVRDQYRGGFLATIGAYNFEIAAEVLGGCTIGSEETFRYPDNPLP